MPTTSEHTHLHAVQQANSTAPTAFVEQPLPPILYERVCRTFIRLAQQIQEIKDEHQELSATKEETTSVPLATDPTPTHH